MPTKLEIEVGVRSQWRTAEPFRPSTQRNEMFALTTNLDDYTDDLPAFFITVWNYIVDETEATPIRTVSAQIFVRIDNVTHPVTAPGVVKLPKAFREFQLTHEQLLSSASLLEPTLAVVAQLRQVAKY